jgi:hypothetical protein
VLSVVRAAEPPNFKRLAVIVVVRVDLARRAADLAGLADKGAVRDRGGCQVNSALALGGPRSARLTGFPRLMSREAAAALAKANAAVTRLELLAAFLAGFDRRHVALRIWRARCAKRNRLSSVKLRYSQQGLRGRLGALRKRANFLQNAVFGGVDEQSSGFGGLNSLGHGD